MYNPSPLNVLHRSTIVSPLLFPLMSHKPYIIISKAALCSNVDLLTSVVYAQYPINAGNITTYAKVILAVLPVHLKYLCLLRNISAHH